MSHGTGLVTYVIFTRSTATTNMWTLYSSQYSLEDARAAAKRAVTWLGTELVMVCKKLPLDADVSLI